MGDDSRVTQAIGRVKRDGRRELERLKSRLAQVHESNNEDVEVRVYSEFRDFHVGCTPHMTIQAFCVLIWAISQTCGALKSKFISIQLIINNNQIITTMTTSTQLATGLGGAIGCDFRTAQNQLIFVEYAGGKLSSLNLFPVATIVAQSPSTVLKGTFLFDFDNGVEGG